MVSINPRLLACTDFVTGKGTVCDVGTDHAYLPVYLILSKKCSNVIAADINDGPLCAAQKTLEKYNVSECNIKLIKSNGLLNIPMDGITDVVIAGMGAELISEIISKAEWLKNGINLILQPMTHISYLRKWLYANGYEILNEKAVLDERFVYTVIKSVYSGNIMQIDSVFENIGKLDLSKKESKVYAQNQIKRLETAGFGIQKSSNEKENDFLKTAEKIRKLLEE